MAYYHNLITEKSWKELQQLRRNLDFVLIGGWAVYLHAKALKSKDIDIVLDYDMLSRIRKLYDVTKNDRLKKYEAIREDVQIDIYLPHYSQIGIPAEDLYTHAVSLDNFRVVDVNYLIVLKLWSFFKRGNSTKGRKDFIDIVSLLSTKSRDYKQIKRVISDYHLQECLSHFLQTLRGTFELKELGLNKHAFARRKKDMATNL